MCARRRLYWSVPLFALAVGLLPLDSARSQILVLSTGIDEKPADPDYLPSRTVFDCSGRDTLVLAPGMVEVLADDTSDGLSDLDSYPCVPWNEFGREHIYRLEVGEPLELWAALRDLGSIDLDLFLLSDCDSESCLVGVNTEFGIALDPGTYYLVVDGYGTSSSTAGPYTLELETRWPGLAPAACTDATAIACTETVTTESDSLYNLQNLIQTYDCGADPLRGGERWYAVELAGEHEATFTVTTSLATLDLALWLFAGCGPDAVCLGFANNKIGGQPETLVHSNETVDLVTVYLAVDSPRPVDDEQDTFTIDFNCQSIVANEKTSWGTLRALYR